MSESSVSGAIAAAIDRGNLFAERCPSRTVLEHLTSRWGVLILVALSRGTRRFSELRREIGGINERMLALTLRRLEGDGLVARESFPVIPPHVEYSLTPMGREAEGLVEALTDWIEVNLPRVLAARAQTDGAEEDL